MGSYYVVTVSCKRPGSREYSDRDVIVDSETSINKCHEIAIDICRDRGLEISHVVCVREQRVIKGE